MSAAELLLLEKIDARYPDRLEHPAELDWPALMARVEQVVAICERIAGERFHIDYAQDASYCADVMATYQVGNRVFTKLGVRFSSFADLFTVWCSGEDGEDGTARVSAPLVAQIIEATRLLGFVYVDESTLALPYTGVIAGLKDPQYAVNTTWFGRFFDYL